MKAIRIALLAGAMAAALWAQQFKFNLDHLAAKASNAVDVSLSKAMLQFGAKFLGRQDPEEAKVKKLISGLDGIYIKASSSRRTAHGPRPTSTKVRNQLKAPGMVAHRRREERRGQRKHRSHVRTENGKVTGVAILAADPREFTVANIVGNVDLDSLADLGGHSAFPSSASPSRVRRPEKEE